MRDVLDDEVEVLNSHVRILGLEEGHGLVPVRPHLAYGPQLWGTVVGAQT